MASNFDRGGYEVDFVEGEPSHSTCCICLFILRNPMQGRECGHRFCTPCAEQLPSTDGMIICPEDRKKVELFPDLGKERELLDLMVKCSNSKMGCSWSDHLRHFDDHVKACGFSMIACTNSDCNKEVLRMDFQNHVDKDCEFRTIHCQTCGHEYQSNPVMFCCPQCKGFKDKNGGEQCIITREQMSFLVERIQNLEAKSKTQQDLLEIQQKKLEEETERNVSLRSQIAQLETLKNSVSIEDSQIVLSNEHVWRINKFEKKRQQAAERFNTEPLERYFYTSRGHKIRIKLFLDGREGSTRGKYVCLSLAAVEGCFDDAVQWPVKATIQFQVKNQAGNTLWLDHIDTRQSINARFFQKPDYYEKGSIRCDEFIPVSGLKSAVFKNMLILIFDVEYSK
ncbi:TNF receptor-associated factor 4-like isoform X2 [Clytia hemisphaerica]|uniref:Uncharacterized protein n=2 Tax=Clytia hemisphaerica TaxID=252671 RepID=A0A7M5XMT8_9CNID